MQIVNNDIRNILIKGGVGTGKTYTARSLAYYYCHQRLSFFDAIEASKEPDYERVEDFCRSEYCEFIQAHPSMSYEDIVCGLSINADTTFNISYTEKRVIELCNRAQENNDLYCIIIDDASSTNISQLLGNLVYAIDNRDEKIEFCSARYLSIPKNVIFIIVENSDTAISKIDYAIRRRMDFTIELRPNRQILENYYSSSAFLAPAKEIILNVYDLISDFAIHERKIDGETEADSVIPGHCLFFLPICYSPSELLQRLKFKIQYIIIPYLLSIFSSAVSQAKIITLWDQVNDMINVGILGQNRICSVRKIFINSESEVQPFNFDDSRDYFWRTIAENALNDSKSVLEYFIDAMLLNNILPVDMVMSSILTNTTIAKIECEDNPGHFASFLLEKERCSEFYYKSTRGENRVPHAYYSTSRVRSGRWRDAIAYRFSYNDGTPQQVYVPLNGVRHHGYSRNDTILATSNNAAEIYKTIFILIDEYLKIYTNALQLRINTGDCNDILNIVLLERKLLLAIDQGVAEHTGDDEKYNYFVSQLPLFKTIWNTSGQSIQIDRTKFDRLVANEVDFSILSYQDIFNITTNNVSSIKIEGVQKMIDTSDYQSIMDSLGIHQMIFQGPPGTSKTFGCKKFVLSQLNPNSQALSENVDSQEMISHELENYKIKTEDYENPEGSDKLTTGGWDIVQFHPSYGYEDFIRGIEVETTNNGSPSYKSVNKILGKLAALAEIASKNPNSNAKFYLIIDEINRANLATVFGEMIYGLEYRNSDITTPYEVSLSDGTKTREIKLCNNLYIIGTMNTADKSIDSLDYAIRRRFLFIDCPPNRDLVLNSYQRVSGNTDENSIELLLFDSVKLLFDDDNFFNNEYRKNDVMIGHTFFLRSTMENYIDKTIMRFIYQVIPILREYIKDGILESIDDLKSKENSSESIASATVEERAKLLSINLMFYIRDFGDKTRDGQTVDNDYIDAFIRDLCTRLTF